MNARLLVLCALALLLAGGAALWWTAADDLPADDAAPDPVGTSEPGSALLQGHEGAAARAERAGAAPRPRLRVCVVWPDNQVRTATVFAHSDGHAPLEAETDAQGWAVFPAVPSRRVTLTAVADDGLRGVDGASLMRDEVNVAYVCLGDAITITGRVVDAATGKPIRGAQVGVLDGRRSGRRPGIVCGTTDEDGHYETWWRSRSNGGSHASHVLCALASGYAAGIAPFPKVEDETTRVALDFDLLAGGVLRGTVRRSGGTVVVGAEVELLPQSGVWTQGSPREGADAREAFYVGHTDQHGKYEVVGLTLDEVYAARANRPGLGRSPPVYDIAPTKASPIAHADLVLTRFATLHLRILGPDGATLPSASVTLGIDGGFQQPTAEGVYVFEDVAAGPQRISVRARGLRPFEDVIEVPEGVVTLREIRMHAGTSITGVLVDRDGKPLPGELVAAQGEDRIAVSSTDDTGRFVLAGLNSGRHRVGVAGSVLCPTIEVDAPASGLRIVASSHGRIRLQTDAPRGARPILVRFEVEGSTYERAPIKTSDTEPGLYVFDVPTGQRDFLFVPIGAVPFRRTVDVPPSGAAELTATLRPGRSLDIHVVDELGTPVVASSVHLKSYSGHSGSKVAAGHFRFAHLGEEAIKILVESNTHGWAVVTHDPTTRPVLQITLRSKTLVHGRLRDARGRPVSAEMIWLRQIGDEEGGARGTTSDIGAFRFHVLPGRSQVGIRRHGNLMPLATVDVPDHGRLELDLRLP